MELAAIRRAATIGTGLTNPSKHKICPCPSCPPVKQALAHPPPLDREQMEVAGIRGAPAVSNGLTNSSNNQNCSCPSCPPVKQALEQPPVVRPRAGDGTTP